MSAYIVSNETINTIAWGFVTLGVDYYPKNSHGRQIRNVFVNDTIQKIGESLLQQNYDSVNYRYGEKESAPKVQFDKPKEFDFGRLYGCIQCYRYQACEVPNYDTCEIECSLKRLETAITEHLIKAAGLNIPWGIY